MSGDSKNVCVVVLGDIGRSPRIQYHSMSLMEIGHKVDIIGYGDTQPVNEVKTAPLIYYHYMMPYPSIPQKFINYVFKTIWQAVNLLLLLFIVRKPDVLLVQNPPAIPSLIVCWIFTRIVKAKFIIDWHNYAHSIMALNLSEENLLVKITKKVEIFIGQRADNNFCVTKAMKMHLGSHFSIRATTLYDRPPLIFRSIDIVQKHDFLLGLGKKYQVLIKDCNPNATVFTEVIGSKVQLKFERPGLLVSSTSWTEDEDFSILFSALEDYETRHQSGNERNLPNLICVITGKGHLKEYYCNKIKDQQWNHVTVITPWLEADEYPLMLASADLGVCLHTSSSGLDLPMKVVDMFGCGLPVCAYDFECLGELVQHGKNGYTFRTSEELSIQLQNWFDNFPKNKKQMEIENGFKSEINTFQKLRWKENWMQIASNVF